MVKNLAFGVFVVAIVLFIVAMMNQPTFPG